MASTSQKKVHKKKALKGLLRLWNSLGEKRKCKLRRLWLGIVNLNQNLLSPSCFLHCFFKTRERRQPSVMLLSFRLCILILKALSEVVLLSNSKRLKSQVLWS